MIEKAYTEYVARQERRSDPDMVLVRTDGPPSRRHVPTGSERMPCCKKGMTTDHLRSAKHVAHLFGIDANRFVAYCKRRRSLETKELRSTYAAR